MKRLSELLGTKVTTESGQDFGCVRGVRAEVRPRSVAITALVVGGYGYLERLGIGAPESRGRNLRRDVVPWSAVVRADAGGIVVRDPK